MASNVWFVLHHSLQTLRAVERGTPREQYRKRDGRSRRFALSQRARDCFPHRPRHVNWFECSSMAPPHSGQRQFTMADLTLSLTDLRFLTTYGSFNQRELQCFKASHLARRRFLTIAVTTQLPSRFHRTLLLIISLSLTRALASRAFTVPLGTPRRSAVSRMLKPSTWRNWKVVRKVGDSREVA